MDAANATITPMPSEPGALGEREQSILAFERQWWKYAGAKEQAIRELFDMSATRYYQILNALVEKPEALAADPAREAAAAAAREPAAHARGASPGHRALVSPRCSGTATIIGGHRDHTRGL